MSLKCILFGCSYEKETVKEENNSENHDTKTITEKTIRKCTLCDKNEIINTQTKVIKNKNNKKDKNKNNKKDKNKNNKKDKNTVNEHQNDNNDASLNIVDNKYNVGKETGVIIDSKKFESKEELTVNNKDKKDEKNKKLFNCEKCNFEKIDYNESLRDGDLCPKCGGWLEELEK